MQGQRPPTQTFRSRMMLRTSGAREDGWIKFLSLFCNRLMYLNFFPKLFHLLK